MDFAYPSFEGLQRFPSSASVRQDVEQSEATGTAASSNAALHDVRKVKAVIIIGGPKDGTRFRPLSLKTPKPLFPIAGVPMIYHQMEACAQVAGMAEIFLIGCYPEADIAAFAAAAGQNLGLPVRYLREFKPLGTAGGLYFFRDLIITDSPDAVVVLHADICADFRLTELIDVHASRGEGNHITIMSTTARRDQAINYGCLVSDEATMAVMHYVEKPDSFISTDINTGIYCFSPKIFEDMKDAFLRNHAAGKQNPEEIWLERDVITALAGSGRAFVHKSSAFWSQIKTASSAIYASRHYLEVYRQLHPSALAQSNAGDGPVIDGDVWIHGSADIHPTAKLGPNVAIGRDVKIGPGTRIKDAIILKGVTIGSHSVIMNSIIDNASTIGDWARIEGAPVGANPNDPQTSVQPKPLFTKDGRLEPSSTIIGSETTIHDGVLVMNVISLPNKDLTSDCKNQIIL